MPCHSDRYTSISTAAKSLVVAALTSLYGMWRRLLGKSWQELGLLELETKDKVKVSFHIVDLSMCGALSLSFTQAYVSECALWFEGKGYKIEWEENA